MLMDHKIYICKVEALYASIQIKYTANERFVGQASPAMLRLFIPKTCMFFIEIALCLLVLREKNFASS